ncbi:hypothetical protein ACFQY5_27340 [Paeniroseomonas aquatica]|uniref:Formate dehydrogenase n=1 Tax=Paeniroseomonas aquatica TaxID=373043 RepID=A0ABT8A8T3_9PROT|nr:hypothetical protein [Paeniroseomonas aquatica]MDN3566119.1 hypothetical protein [Paeniroseomonas aquatica]
MTDKTGAERRGFLRALGLGTAAAAAGSASAGAAVVQRADTVPAGQAAKENDAQRRAARYVESDEVKAFYRTNRYEQ